MQSELPVRGAGPTGNARIAPDMRIGDTGYDAPDTDELAEIVNGLQYYARWLHQLKLCAQNAKSPEDEQAERARQSFRVITFPQGRKG
jgi:hypothetical protein